MIWITKGRTWENVSFYREFFLIRDGGGSGFPKNFMKFWWTFFGTKNIQKCYEPCNKWRGGLIWSFHDVIIPKRWLDSSSVLGLSGVGVGSTGVGKFPRKKTCFSPSLITRDAHWFSEELCHWLVLWSCNPCAHELQSHGTLCEWYDFTTLRK